MASGFPGSIDNFTDPLSNSSLSSPSHSGLHSDVNDAIEKIETYMGLVKVIPTSVAGTGVTLSASGTVTYTGATTVSINGCFTSLYDGYRIQWITTALSANPNVYFQLRKSGVNTAANYFWSAWYTSNGGTNGQSVASPGTSVNPAYGSSATPQGFQIIEMWGPAATRNTTFNFTENRNDTGGQIIRNGGGIHVDATSHDGISFTASTGTMGGTITIYGYRS